MPLNLRKVVLIDSGPEGTVREKVWKQGAEFAMFMPSKQQRRRLC